MPAMSPYNWNIDILVICPEFLILEDLILATVNSLKGFNNF
jgi:hypothetical protein